MEHLPGILLAMLEKTLPITSPGQRKALGWLTVLAAFFTAGIPAALALWLLAGAAFTWQAVFARAFE